MRSRILRRIAVGVVAGTAAASIATPTVQATPLEKAAGFTLTSKKQLKSLWVPSMCNNPAGKLKDGKLPGYHVELNYPESKLGQIRPGGGKEAAAVFGCSQGGIGWPNHIVFYATDGKIIGHFDTASVGFAPGRQLISSVSISKKNAVTVNVIAVPLQGDNELWGSAGARLNFKWDGKSRKVVRTSTKIYSDTKGVANKLLSLIRDGKTTQAKKYATASIVKTLTNQWRNIKNRNKNAKKKGSIKIGRCIGRQSDSPYGSWFWESFAMNSRSCSVIFTWPMGKGEPEQFRSDSMLNFDHKQSDMNWTSWYARKMIGVAG